MNKEQKESLKTTIIKDIEKVEEEIEALKPKLYPLKKDCSIDKVEHKALKIEQNIAIQQFEEAKIRKNQLVYALHNIDNSDYGICKECEEEIPFERLKLIPYSQYCVECQEEISD